MLSTTPERARLLDDIASITFDDPIAAFRLCQPLLNEARAASDIVGIVRAATQLSLIEDQLGIREEGGLAIAEALQLCQQYQLTDLEPAAQERMGRHCYTSGDYLTAAGAWLRCLMLCGNDATRKRIRVLALVGLAHVCSACGDYQRSIAFLQAADRLLTGSDDIYMVAKVRITLGWDLCMIGSRDEARQMLESALAQCREHDFGHYQAELLLRLSELRLEEGALDTAEQMLEEAMELLVFTPSHWCEANVLAALATVRRHQGEYEQAIRLLQRGLDIANSDGMLHVEAKLRYQLAELAQATGRQELAAEQRQRAQVLQAQIDQHLPVTGQTDWYVIDDAIARFASPIESRGRGGSSPHAGNA
ncbi:tetratricopeptide repeat protein [Chitinolyticbacter albus]|uniref:tetratricopeptide repeat protein n=1 Tax=Chitinolyticbacter albus TaxID=2961951 RepID=UPI00210B6028|nr:tetratricopeptide repeat protein [Chitinolyticbacter albus]